MDYLPLCFDLKTKPCLIVGGGKIAYRKAVLLNKAGAVITVVAPTISQELAALAEQSGGQLFNRAYNSDDLTGCIFVVGATDIDAVNRQIAADANKLGLLVNIVDNPALCNIIFPALIDRNPILVSVSSSGSAPVLARAVRSQIESSVPANIGELAEFIAARRPHVRQLLGNDEQRVRLFWEQLLDSEIAERVFSGRLADAQRLFQQRLEAAAINDRDSHLGEVYLVGAGPGDPDLLTFKALRLMQRADVVLYDRLVSPAIVDMTRRDAERIYVGKSMSEHTVPQGEINQLLIDLAKAGNKVVRLKGGDPFVFGRGGEEIEGLAEHGIPFQIVPGISAANGCACYSGIPLTHRDHAQSVRFITGHLKDGSMDLPWDELVQEAQTVVIYMGLTGLTTICQQLIRHGRDADTPVALIERGTTPAQQTYVGTLATMPDIVAQQTIHPPTLIIIGSVVSLQQRLQWFDK